MPLKQESDLADFLLGCLFLAFGILLLTGIFAALLYWIGG